MGAYEEEGRAVNHIKAGIITADRVVTVCVGVGGCECGCKCVYYIKAGIITADRVVTVCVGVGRCGCGWV